MRLLIPFLLSLLPSLVSAGQLYLLPQAIQDQFDAYQAAVTYRDQVRDALQAGQLEASIQVLVEPTDPGKAFHVKAAKIVQSAILRGRKTLLASIVEEAQRDAEVARQAVLESLQALIGRLT